jgi:hypothetical protein
MYPVPNTKFNMSQGLMATTSGLAVTENSVHLHNYISGQSLRLCSWLPDEDMLVEELVSGILSRMVNILFCHSLENLCYLK